MPVVNFTTLYKRLQDGNHFNRERDGLIKECTRDRRTKRTVEYRRKFDHFGPTLCWPRLRPSPSCGSGFVRAAPHPT